LGNLSEQKETKIRSESRVTRLGHNKNKPRNERFDQVGNCL